VLEHHGKNRKYFHSDQKNVWFDSDMGKHPLTLSFMFSVLVISVFLDSGKFLKEQLHFLKMVPLNIFNSFNYFKG